MNGSKRVSGKAINGSVLTAGELAKRNAARMLLPYGEIKALEKKAKLEAEFDWQKAKAKCVEIVPEFKLSIIINDLVKAGTLRQAHPSDYGRKEWLVIYNACKHDAETNDNDDDDNNDGGGKPSPSDNGYQEKLAECRDAARDFVRYSWLKDDMIKDGELPNALLNEWTDDDFAKLKEACEIDASLFGRGIGECRIHRTLQFSC